MHVGVGDEAVDVGANVVGATGYVLCILLGGDRGLGEVGAGGFQEVGGRGQVLGQRREVVVHRAGDFLSDGSGESARALLPQDYGRCFEYVAENYWNFSF